MGKKKGRAGKSMENKESKARQGDKEFFLFYHVQK